LRALAKFRRPPHISRHVFRTLPQLFSRALRHLRGPRCEAPRKSVLAACLAAWAVWGGGLGARVGRPSDSAYTTDGTSRFHFTWFGVRFEQWAARICALLLALPLFSSAQDAPPPAAATRPPVNHRRNIEEFPAVEARFIRFTFQKTNGGQPCIDELEIFGPADPARNLALAENGVRATASGTLEEYRIHALRHINDGIYGNAHSWICNTVSGGWVELELPAPARVNRLVWSRDREGKYQDRVATDYRIEIALEPGKWQVVATAADRAPLAGIPSASASNRSIASRFAPSAGEISGPTRPAARDYVLQTWQTAQGLPANAVTALVQAHDGWLWVGTANGLARFDGARFTTFGESHGLPSLRVTCLLEDRRGTLWVGTQHGGLARLENGRFTTVPVGDGAGENSIFSLAQDAAGHVWIGAANGLYEFRAGAAVRRVSGQALRIAPEASGEGVWFLAGNNTLTRWVGGRLEYPDPTLEPARFSSLSTLAFDGKNALWFGGPNEYLARFSEGRVTTFADGHPALTSVLWEILPTAGGDVWMGTSASGLARLRGTDVLSLTTDDGLPANSILALCEDREGNLWVGTNGGGLTRLRERRITALTMGDGLSQNSIMALAEDAAGTIWIGTNGGGLNRWANGHAEPYNPSYLLENDTIASLASLSDRSLWIGALTSGMSRLLEGRLDFIPERLLPGRNVTAFCPDAADNLWVGTLDGGPLYFADHGPLPIPAVASLAGQPITAIVVQHALRPPRRALATPPAEASSSYSFSPFRPLGPLAYYPGESLIAAQPPDGTIWFGTAAQGVARLQDGKISRFTPAEGLASNFVRTLRFDDTGALWVGTSGGLSRWRSGHFESFGLAQGLPDAVISQILDDGAGCLWLGTNRGILRVARQSFDDVAAGRAATLETLALDITDGLPSLECTGGYHPAGLRTGDGRLLFATVAGLAIIDPAKFTSPAAPPPVVIEEIALGTQLVPLGLVGPAGLLGPASPAAQLAESSGTTPASPARPLEIAPDAGPLKIRFTALSFTAPQRVRLRYRLEGLETAWTENAPSATRTAAYPHLPPGAYRFIVQASQDGRAWSPVGASFALRVLAPWWRTPWALAAGILASIALVASIARFAARRRLKRRLREVEQKLALERERTRIARDIHDQLGANLTQIALLSAPQSANAVPAVPPARDEADQLPSSSPPADRTEFPTTTERFAAIASTANDLVQAVDAIVWAVNPKHGTLESLARYLVRFAEDFLAPTPLRLRLDVPPQLPASPLSSEVRHNLFLAAREALNNAVRHAHATELHLTLRAENGQLTVVIADNGRGFEPATAAQDRGNGLENLHRRLADCGGACTITSQPKAGTVVTFRLPLPPSAP
jgi:signal transduction histidine kinase/ligand-binding sensor domain-containing protein